MRKPRDFDSELKALADKAKQLKERRVRDLGALVTATGADALDADVLAGALLDAATSTDKAKGEGWRKRGAAFFQGRARGTSGGPRQQPEGTLPLDGGAASA
ncbi:conjugal transfer protein TraD [Sphingorhabdus sp.]|uniref:conjugal transfer protein TraD n=1 Tax=Sphingorhabdus sp. TaxID=1902408 RepID=UPI0035ADF072|nr:conjugal transfer protein TraD [Sphingomonadaceae bacterium]